MHIYDEQIDILRPTQDIWEGAFNTIDDACCLESRSEQGRRIHLATFTNDADQETEVRLARLIDDPSNLITLTAPTSNDKDLSQGLKFSSSQLEQYPVVNDERFYSLLKLSKNDEFEIEQIIMLKNSANPNYVNYAGNIWSFDKYFQLNQKQSFMDGCILEISRPGRIINLTGKRNNELHLDIELRIGQRIVREKRQLQNGLIEYYYSAIQMKRVGISDLYYGQRIIEE